MWQNIKTDVNFEEGMSQLSVKNRFYHLLGKLPTNLKDLIFEGVKLELPEFDSWDTSVITVAGEMGQAGWDMWFKQLLVVTTKVAEEFVEILLQGK